MDIPQIQPRDLAAALAEDPALVLLDIRPPAELTRARLPFEHVHIPAAQLARRFSELDEDARIVVCCHFGIRSIAAAALLIDRDFDDVASLAGGIDLYAREVDPSIPRY